MKSTGIVRKVDELGRVVIPMEIRRTLGINVKDEIEIYIDGDRIFLRKYQPENICQITGKASSSNIKFGNGIILSREGAEQLISEIQAAFKEE